MIFPTTRFQVTFFVAQNRITNLTECYLQYSYLKIKPKHKAHWKSRSQKCKNPVHEFQTIFSAEKPVNSNQRLVWEEATHMLAKGLLTVVSGHWL